MPTAAQVAKLLRPTTLEDVHQDFNALKEIGCGKSVPLARTGLVALDYFFLQHRIKAKTKHGFSFYDALSKPEIINYVNKKVAQIKAGKPQNTETQKLRLQYDVFQLYYGTINQFRPTEAMKLYCLLKPKIGILDFSAGWGGRCLAAMALKIPYIGIDANEKLEKPYNDMINMANPDSKVTMIFKPSETITYSKYKYDLIFTSPPYFMLEVYEKMPTYESKVAFLDTFFRPVIERAWNNLASGGHLALNMPVEMYEAVKKCLAPLKKKIELALAHRHAGNASGKKEFGTEPAYKEYTYVWKKTSRNKTLKCKRGSLIGGKRNKTIKSKGLLYK
jgi:hypothetical protein